MCIRDRRVRLCPGSPRHPCWHHSRHGPDRDLPGRVRDGRDPLRAAGALLGAQRRSLGLHLQRHQEVLTRGREFLLPDRAQVTMTVPFMHAYSELLVASCHKRGAHAIGGMAAFIPSKDLEVNEAAFAKVEEDKNREAGAGFDGSWVAHPGMVEVCKAAFTAVLGQRPNQIDKLRQDVHVTAEQLLDVAATPGEVTEAGLRNNISVGIQYLASWLRGSGAVAIFNLMEDAATAEISRSQVWQWLHNDIVLADTAEVVTRELVERIVDEEIAKLPGEPGDYAQARATFVDVAIADDFAEFLTLPCLLYTSD